jgi:hypothetical protein
LLFDSLALGTILICTRISVFNATSIARCKYLRV